VTPCRLGTPQLTHKLQSHPVSMPPCAALVTQPSQFTAPRGRDAAAAGLPHPETRRSNASSTLFFGIYQKLAGAQVQGSRNSLEVVEGNVSLPPLDRPHISAVNPALVSE